MALRDHLYLKCEHFLLVYIVKQNKKICGFYKKNREFTNFYENRILLEAIFEILIIHKPFLGSFEVPHKIWAH